MSINTPKAKGIATVNLRNLKYSPNVNPLISSQEIVLRKGLVRTGGYEDLINKDGEVEAVSVIHKSMELDDEHFVKMFAAGIAASFELDRTSQRVLTAVLAAYERAPMKGGYADWVELFWFGDGLDGQTLDMSEKTFQRGLKDLLARGFLAPRNPTTFWTNPHLFFKGNRVLFVTEYKRKSEDAAIKALPVKPLPDGLGDTDIPY